jgi:hypothetical protein
LDVSAVLYSSCEPTNQTGRVNTNCPGLQMGDGFPFFGALMEGCCRPLTQAAFQMGGPGECGYLDPVAGLGCIPSDKVDGVTTSPEGCTYVP